MAGSDSSGARGTNGARGSAQNGQPIAGDGPHRSAAGAGTIELPPAGPGDADRRARVAEIQKDAVGALLRDVLSGAELEAHMVATALRPNEGLPLEQPPTKLNMLKRIPKMQTQTVRAMVEKRMTGSCAEFLMHEIFPNAMERIDKAVRNRHFDIGEDFPDPVDRYLPGIRLIDRTIKGTALDTPQIRNALIRRTVRLANAIDFETVERPDERQQAMLDAGRQAIASFLELHGVGLNALVPRNKTTPGQATAKDGGDESALASASTSKSTFRLDRRLADLIASAEPVERAIRTDPVDERRKASKGEANFDGRDRLVKSGLDTNDRQPDLSGGQNIIPNDKYTFAKTDNGFQVTDLDTGDVFEFGPDTVARIEAIVANYAATGTLRKEDADFLRGLGGPFTGLDDDELAFVFFLGREAARSGKSVADVAQNIVTTGESIAAQVPPAEQSAGQFSPVQFAQAQPAPVPSEVPPAQSPNRPPPNLRVVPPSPAPPSPGFASRVLTFIATKGRWLNPVGAFLGTFFGDMGSIPSDAEEQRLEAEDARRARENTQDADPNVPTGEDDPDPDGPPDSGAPPDLQVGRIELPDTTHTVDPYSEDDFDRLLRQNTSFDPDRLAPTHDTICHKFSDGSEVVDLVEQLVNGERKPEDIEPVAIFACFGRLFSANNRRLYMFRVAKQLIPELKIPVRAATPDEIKLAKDTERSFTTRNLGDSAKLNTDPAVRAQIRQRRERARQQRRRERRGLQAQE